MSARYREQFEKEVIERGFTAFEEYSSSKVRVRMMCPKGHEFKILPGIFIKGGTCRTCSYAAMGDKTRLEFANTISKLGGTVIGSYMGLSTGIECICVQGHHCYPIPQVIRLGYGMCNDCRINKVKEFFYQKAKEAGVTLLGEYVSTATPVQAICKNGHQCAPRPAVIRQGYGFCVTCAGGDGIIAKEKFLNWMREHGYKVLGEYVNTETKVKSICASNHLCYARPQNISKGKGMCKRCRVRSQGEDKVDDSLRILNLNFNREFCILPKRSRYDFEIPNLKIMIETDGQQHFEIDGAYAQTAAHLKINQMQDVLKMMRARVEGYKIIGIDYTWYKKPVEEFVDYLKPLLESVDSLLSYTYTTPEMYNWVHDLMPAEFLDD